MELQDNLSDRLIESLILAQDKALSDSELNRLRTFQDFTVLWNREYSEVQRLIFKYFLNKPYSQQTLERMFIVYQDVIRKVVKRLTSGILTPPPNIDYEVGTGTDGAPVLSVEFEELLQTSNFLQKIMDAFRKAIFFNTVIAEPVWRNDTLDIDVLTGADCVVETGADYLKIKEIAVARVDENKDLIASYWSETEHYITRGGDKVAPQNNESMTNPYGLLPFSVLRIEDGLDFWGEPNWGLFVYQLVYTLSKSDNFLGEAFQKFPLLWGENAELPSGAVFGPGLYFNFDNPNSPAKNVSLNTLDTGTNWDAIIRLQEHNSKQFFVNEGLPASSASTDANDLSGKAKEIDTLELFEERPVLQLRLKNFAEDLLRKMIVVYNAHTTGAKIPEKGNILFRFNEDETLKTTDEVIKERDMQKKYFIADEIDFIMQDLDLSEDAAIEHYNKRKLRATGLSGGTVQGRQRMTFGEILQNLTGTRDVPDGNQTDETVPNVNAATEV